MRVVVYGLGAVGGSVAAALTRAGTETIGIARGSHLEAIRTHGLRFRAPDVDERVRVTCAASPSEIDFRTDDTILLAMKTQDTQAALMELRDAGVSEQPIFCLQNGVANERMALRLFPNVHGVTVMMPSTYLVPGEVAAFGTPCFGLLDIGRFPAGHDTADTALADVLNAAGFGAFVTDSVMSGKYGKLLMNLGNIVRAALGRGTDVSEVHRRLKSEAIAVYKRAGIKWQEVGASDPRRSTMLQLRDIPGVERGLGSTTQSLTRGQPLETDFLNGEIAFLGRFHKVPTPLNAEMCRVAAELSASGVAPGSLTLDALNQRLASA